MVLSLLALMAPAPLADAVVYVIRHAEKPAAGRGLAPKGEQRARAYATYFQKDPQTHEPLRLTAIFATAASKSSDRPVLTVSPLSQATGLAIQKPYADDQYSLLTHYLQGKPHGNRILICWHHGKLPKLLVALGVGEPDLPKYLPAYPDPPAAPSNGKWPSDCYDRVVALRFDHLGKLKRRESALDFERLLPGDEIGPNALAK